VKKGPDGISKQPIDTGAEAPKKHDPMGQGETMMRNIFTILILSFAVLAFPAGVAQVVTIPSVTNSAGQLITQTDERQSVLDGREFFASRSFTAVTQEFLLVTGGVAPRVSISISNTSGASLLVPSALVEWYESASVLTTTGTLVDKFNVNRARTNTGGMKITHSPSALSAATTTMPSYLVPTDKGNSRDTGNPITGSGWILKASTAYFIRITPGSSSTVTYVQFSWKE
jgi:hypothetical protein